MIELNLINLVWFFRVFRGFFQFFPLCAYTKYSAKSKNVQACFQRAKEIFQKRIHSQRVDSPAARWICMTGTIFPRCFHIIIIFLFNPYKSSWRVIWPKPPSNRPVRPGLETHVRIIIWLPFFPFMCIFSFV